VATLYERVTKNVFDAQQYISVTDIIGVLETVKLSVHHAAHMFVAEELTNVLTEKETKH
jgi:hypothetical protein